MGTRDRFSPYEFALVIGVGLGWAILGSVSSFLYGGTVGEAGAPDAFDSSHLYSVVLTELLCFPAVAAILYARGWRLKDFPMGIGKAATILGLVAFAAIWMLDIAIEAALVELFASLRPAIDQWNSYQPSDPPDYVAIYLLSVVNPVFEEVIVCGYVIPALSGRFGVTTAVNVSVVIRLLYHLYQGVAALPFHLAYGLVQAYLFLRYRKLWPLIVNHAALDFVGLAYL